MRGTGKIFPRNQYTGPKSIEERILGCVEKTESGCWVWKLGVTNKGYGRININGKIEGAHRVSYQIFVGPIPEGMNVLHRCDNPPCINPEHLWLGTIADNNADMSQKGRNNRAEKHHNHKLTWDQVREIRRLYATGEYFERELGAIYGVNQYAISRIITGKGWKE